MATAVLPAIVRDHRRTNIDKVLASPAFQRVLTARTQQLQYSPLLKVYTPPAKARAKAFLELTNGTVPYQQYTNVITGARWGSYVVLGAKDSYVMQKPLPAGAWWAGLKDLVDDVGHVFVDFGKLIKSALSNLCALINSNQATEAAVVAGLVSAGAITAGTATVVGGATALAMALCAKAFTPDPSPTATAILSAGTVFLPATNKPATNKPPAPTYPAGTVGRWNVRTHYWSLYAPAGTLSAAPPAGMQQVGVSETLPPGVPDTGTEGEWFKSPWSWVGILGGSAILGGGVFLARRWRRG